MHLKPLAKTLVGTIFIGGGMWASSTSQATKAKMGLYIKEFIVRTFAMPDP